jgi:hypothetical protein
MMVALAFAGLVLALIPFALGMANLLILKRPRPGPGPLPGVSVLIPARNEEARIALAVSAVLASRGVMLECLVYDDQSTDRTADIVRELAAWDDRVWLIQGPPLPPGWVGKNHACHQLSERAHHEILVFVDADVVLDPDALAALAGVMPRDGPALVSGVPRQITGTFAELLAVPLIHFLLYGYLPLARMRRSRSPAYGAACGQVMAVRADAYALAGGHAAIRRWLHDGIMLARTFRRAGLATDLVDLTDLATTRMYTDATQVWNGFAKNATEGMARPLALPIWTVLLGGGAVLPPLLLLGCLAFNLHGGAMALAALGTAIGFATRALFAWRFDQDWRSVASHPLGVAYVLAIQYSALFAALRGKAPPAWRGRTYHLGR